jgi:glutamate/tyrosine decarboxylase-like PLP-dependent enzyme
MGRAGWDVEAQGLFGAPPLTIVTGDEVHASMQKALSLVGFGRERVVRVPVDAQGRMRVDAFPSVDERTIVCVQAGNVNTGAFDPVLEICERARSRGAWVHVDGAFGMWAAAAPSRAHLVRGIEDADSWATDLLVRRCGCVLKCLRPPVRILAVCKPITLIAAWADTLR